MFFFGICARRAGPTARWVPSQINRSNQFRAGIVAVGYNWLPYTLGAGFTVTCSFSHPQQIPAQQMVNVATGERRLYVPGRDVASEGTYHAENFETLQSDACPVCTMIYKAAITSAFVISFSGGEGGSISFGGSGPLEPIDTKTFQMCPAGTGGGGGGGGC